MENQKREVSLAFAVGIIFVPLICGWFLLRDGYSTKARVLGLGWTGLIVLITLFGGDRADSSTSNPSAIAKNEAQQSQKDKATSKVKIPESALIPYTKENGFEKTVKKYGPRLKEIEQYRKLAAEKVMASGKCDSVVASDLSTTKSSLKHLSFWVDCNNGTRVYLDENEIKAGAPVVTQKEKAWTETNAMMACENAIKANATRPSTVDIHHFSGRSFYVAPTTQVAVMRLDFDAKNAFGEEDPFTAICTFPPGEDGTIEVQRRQ